MRIVKQVGNYGEIFERNVGAGLAAQDRARPERAVDQGRPPVRAADPLSALPDVGGRRCRRRRQPRSRGVGMAATGRGRWPIDRRSAPRRILQRPEVRGIVYQVVLCASIVLSRLVAGSSATPSTTCARANIAIGLRLPGTTPPASTSARR